MGDKTGITRTPTDKCDTLLGSPEWEQIFALTVHDPDGWDRGNFAESWAQPISAGEFARRAAESTCSGDFTLLGQILRASTSIHSSTGAES